MLDFTADRKNDAQANRFTEMFRTQTKRKAAKAMFLGVSPLALAACGGGDDSSTAQTLVPGTDGDDVLPNSAANERFEGGLGDDTYTVGLTGTDTVFDAGGDDTVKVIWRDVDNVRQVDEIYAEGDNLVFKMIGASNETTLEKAFAADTRVENVIYYHADGSWGENYTARIFKFGEAILANGTTAHLIVGTNAAETMTFVEGDLIEADIHAAGGDDIITTGDDTQYVHGGDGDDILDGGAGDDMIWGDAGNDIIYAGDGNDTVYGGEGDDTFVFKDGEDGTDTITDFDLAEGDKLDLSSYGITTEEAAEALMSDSSDGVNVTIDGSVIVTMTATTVADFNAADGWLANAEANDNPTVTPASHHSFTTSSGSYVLVAEQKTYVDAAAYARSELNGTLASFETQSEFDGFYSALQSTVATNNLTLSTAPDGGGAEYIWLGATDSTTEGSWVWDSGVSLSYNDLWGSGALGSEPDNFQNQDGMAIGMENWPAGSATGAGYGDAGSWNDIDVSNTLYFVVEIA